MKKINIHDCFDKDGYLTDKGEDFESGLIRAIRNYIYSYDFGTLNRFELILFRSMVEGAMLDFNLTHGLDMHNAYHRENNNG